MPTRYKNGPTPEPEKNCSTSDHDQRNEEQSRLIQQALERMRRTIVRDGGERPPPRSATPRKDRRKER